MYSLLISIVALVLGYIFYGRFIESIYRPDPTRKTAAYTKNDGVDYVPMPHWKVFMIQLLNIAGTGPIFGAILGAKFGPSCYLWIVLGCIFGGAVHDYLSAMMSVRHDGVGLPWIVGHHLGNVTEKIMIVFSVVMLLLVGAVFVYSPAVILGDLTGGTVTATRIWVFVVLAYYIVATLVPIDKIIGKIYPVFAVAIIFMALSLLVCLLIKWPSNIPEVWNGMQNRSPEAGTIFPCMFISIACGAVSGFHATQSPMMARCLKNEKIGRPVFYGSMITEGVIALIWATVSSYFFYAGGNVEMGAEGVTAAPEVVTTVAKSWLGGFGAVLALLGVVAAPITSGDTALRTVRLTVADWFHLDQSKAYKRVHASLPIFLFTALLLWFSIADANGFDKIWRYFGWANQTLSCFTFWALTVYLAISRKGWTFLVTLIPTVFMTSVCGTFILTAKIGLNLPDATIPYLGIGIAAICLIQFCIWYNRKAVKYPDFVK